MAASRRPRPLPSRGRYSAVRLSTDTTASLPAYSSPTSRDSEKPHILDDQPPEYPQSAEEADQEDDFVPLRSPRSSATRRTRHHRTQSASLPTSPSVDDLLERSVVALEMSTNALLQSMNTQSSISTLANDRMLERSLDRQTRMLDLRLRGARDAHEGWMDDLEQLIKGVDGLFADQSDLQSGVSRSLPTTNSHVPPRPRRRPSALNESKSDSPYLHLTTSDLDLRESLRPPRAITQYVSVQSTSGQAGETTADSESIYLPSTTGLRSAPQIKSFVAAESRPHRIRQSTSSPGLNSCHSPSTPAYNMLSHLATQHSSQSPSGTDSPVTSLPSPGPSDTPSHRKTRRLSTGSLESNGTMKGDLWRSRSNSRGRSSASSEHPPPVRAMTPPLEEATPSPSSSTSSLHAPRTMQSLRKILDEAPPDPKGKRPEHAPMRRQFQPRSPSVAPSSGTSTATASITRLLTRSSHHGPHVNAHARQSSLKKTGTPPPGTPSTAPSTPRNVSFAELPDTGRSQRNGKGKGREGRVKGKDRKRGQRAGWWNGWIGDISGGVTGMGGAARQEERMEDRFMRGWGRPGLAGGGAEEWMV